MKLVNSSSEEFLEDIKVKVSQFFMKKLGKKQQPIIKEFNETILGLIHDDMQKKLEDPFEEKKTSNNQEHLSRNRIDREAERRAKNMIDDHIKSTMKSESSELHAADSENEEGKGIKIIKRTQKAAKLDTGSEGTYGT